MQYFAYYVFFCFRNKKFRDYDLILRKAEKDIVFDMDIVQIIRRLRMHGLALTMLTSKQARYYMASASRKKVIDLIDHEDNKHWNKIESLAYQFFAHPKFGCTKNGYRVFNSI